jgi:prepilin-type processing-associated H-X9-DG protein
MHTHETVQGKPIEASFAFTLIELLVVMGILVALAFLLLPVLASSGSNAKALQCINNQRQLCAAWRMYADDSTERMVYSSDDGTGIYPGGNLLDKYAWTLTHMDFSYANRANWDANYSIVKGPLWNYGRDASIYKCPSDKSYIVAPSGVPLARTRSYAMNFYLGGFAGQNLGVYPNMELYFKITDLSGALPSPGPAKTFVFLDQPSAVINWGSFVTAMDGYQPNQPAAYNFNQDLPGIYHNRACTFTFGDGHAEMHRWLDVRTMPPLPEEQYVIQLWSVPNDKDVAWLQDHSTRPK